MTARGAAFLRMWLLVMAWTAFNAGCLRTSPRPAPPAAAPALVAHGDAAAPAPPSAPEELPVEFGWRRQPPSVLCEQPELPANDAGTPAPRAPGIANVRGSMDKEAIRRVIQAHIPAVKDCYESILTGSPPFPEGKVRVRFAIDGAGSVRHSCVIESTLRNTTCERCIVDDLLKWEFPKPWGAGWVVVDYPFVLVPADDRK
jgi:hypothetical protein